MKHVKRRKCRQRRRLQWPTGMSEDLPGAVRPQLGVMQGGKR